MWVVAVIIYKVVILLLNITAAAIGLKKLGWH